MKISRYIAILAMLTPSPAFQSGSIPVSAQGPTISAAPAPSAAEIHALFSRAIENQHRNDLQLTEFERVERVITWKDDGHSQIATDHSSLVLPTGTGVMRIDLPADHSAAAMESYRRDLQQAIAAYELAIHPNDREREDSAKFEKRNRDRKELLDDAGKAFYASWAGRETRGSRTFEKFLLEPNLDYRPTTRFGVVFQHVHAAIWIDETEAQMARVEGDIDSDISFGGGILGKVYKGGHIVMEQQEVEPGVWLPTLFTYDVDGRKFLFGFSLHERTEISMYRRVGPPAQAIEIIRKELSGLATPNTAH